MSIYEGIFLAIIAMGAGYYVYHSVFKKKGCGCGNKDCHAKSKKFGS